MEAIPSLALVGEGHVDLVAFAVLQVRHAVRTLDGAVHVVHRVEVNVALPLGWRREEP